MGSPSDLWENELSLKSQNTQKKYREKFSVFCERWSATPQELFDQRLSDLKSGDPLNFRRMEKMVERSMKEIVDSGRSVSTAKTLKNAVSLFFVAVDMPLKMRMRNTPNGDTVGQKMMRADQQRELHASLNRFNKKRNTAILVTLKDGGWRVSDNQLLTVENYLNAEIFTNAAGEQFRVFNPALTEKCKIRGILHLGPESCNAIDAYLEERREKGLIDGYPTLFINRSHKPFTKDTMTGLISQQCRLLGKKFKKLSAHSLRKFHRSMLLNAGVPNSWIDKYQGKKSDTYARPGEISAPDDLNKLTERYIEAYDALRIFGLSKETKEKLSKFEDMKRSETDIQHYLKTVTETMNSLNERLDELKREAVESESQHARERAEQDSRHARELAEIKELISKR